jgi:hypothetical protein
VRGDVTDPVAVERGPEGADAVLHAASVFSMDPRRLEQLTLSQRRPNALAAPGPDFGELPSSCGRVPDVLDAGFRAPGLLGGEVDVGVGALA